MATDPDAGVVAMFKMMAFKDEPESIKQGRPVFRDEEVCELRYPGSKNVGCFPATGFSNWSTGYDGNQVQVTYAERFKRQYQQFKSEAVQTKVGTPLTYALFLTEARRAELRAQNIYTIEALAEIEGLELKNLGMHGRDLKNKAQEYLAEAKLGAPNAQMMAELEALRAKNVLMEEDLRTLKSRESGPAEPQFAPTHGDRFDGMSLDQLREYIASNTGQAPHGASNRKTLERLARDASPGATTKAA
jgi:hypothetical protein